MHFRTHDLSPHQQDYKLQFILSDKMFIKNNFNIFFSSNNEKL